MFEKLLRNHVLTNLTFLLVMAMGWLAYFQLPREQDPSINFNWVQVWTFWPGATATDVEKRVTEPLEEGIERVKDIKFVSSTSREGVSSILVRFTELDGDDFDKRMTDLRREIQAQQEELPEDVEQPDIQAISSSNAFPTATLVVTSQRSEESLQSAARIIREDLARLNGVQNVTSAGARDPELHVNFLPASLLGLGISPVDLANTVREYFQDLAAGDIAIGGQRWLVRIIGTSSETAHIESFPVVSAQGEVPLRSIAEIRLGRADPQDLVRFQGESAVMLSVFKADKANNIEILEQIASYIEEKNRLTPSTGVRVLLLDDQTQPTRAAIEVMERNAIYGLLMVLFATWIFMGFRIAMLTSIGIPFVLASTFWVLGAADQTLNVTVLLAIVISLGMLVDDSVVVAEAIYAQISKGQTGMLAVRNALQEVGMPVVTAVLTTIAAFLPLMLLPGVLGDFMRVVPVVVSVALVISLVEAFWMLPAHVIQFHGDLGSSGRLHASRVRATRWIRNFYGRTMISGLRRPVVIACMALALFVGAFAVILTGSVKVDFFATDLFRLFYVNVQMPPGTSLESTSEKLQQIEEVLVSHILPNEARGVISYAGQQFTDKELLIGYDKGQIFVSLNPAEPGGRNVVEIMDAMREAVSAVPGPVQISFMRRKTGPPTSKPISIKLRGNDIEEIRAATAALVDVLATAPGVHDITDDDSEGGMMLSLRLDADAITRTNLSPSDVARAIRLYADGEVVASMQDSGEKVEVRVRAKPGQLQDIKYFLDYPIGMGDKGEVPIGELVEFQKIEAVGNIRHQDFRRAVTLEADLDPVVIDTLTANRIVQNHWKEISPQYPGVTLDYSGELDDIQESLGAMAALFILGMGLIFLILGTQFKSYILPILVLATVPMAFTGVVLGLLLSGNPMSLFTLYGAIALAGISANDTIVMISAANANLNRNLPVAMAIAQAARRRVIPILITSLTTIAGLYSLAVGLGGESLMWGPVATAIIWGLSVSTLLTLYITPALYSAVMKPRTNSLLTLALPHPVRTASLNLFQTVTRSIMSRYRMDSALQQALEKTENRELYNTGVDAIRNNNTDTAIRCFEALADSETRVISLQIYAAQAHIMLMEKIGWDIGYIARAKRYAARARAIDPSDNRVKQLEKAIQLLDQHQDAA